MSIKKRMRRESLKANRRVGGVIETKSRLKLLLGSLRRSMSNKIMK
jgi:hypothetical protein